MKNFLFLLLFPAFLNAQSQKIDFNVVLLKGQATDIQTLRDGNTDTGWFPGWNVGDYPVKVRLDLSDEVYLTNIRFFDGPGKPKLTFKTIGDKIVLTKDLGLYNAWQEWEVSTQVKVKQLTVEISDIQAERPVLEIEIWGSKTDKPVPPKPIITKWSGDALKFGVNGFHWIPKELNPTPNIRIYQQFQWSWTNIGGELAVEPTRQADGNYDTYLTAAKKDNTTVIFCINKIPDWYATKVSDEWADMRIHPHGKNSVDPFSYTDVSNYAWQMVARYGSVTYPTDILNVNSIPRWNNDPINEKKSGLNLIKYIELENEGNRPWKSPLFKYTPQEMAAFCSAIWDGHEGKLGLRCGIKKADPNVKLVLPGLSEIDIRYLSEMKKWFEANRVDKRFCADVINVHHYCNTSNPWPGFTVNLVNGNGNSPDQDRLEYRLKDLKLFCFQNFKGLEVWFSEFGYDTTPPSTGMSQYPKTYGNKTAFDLQSQWNMRTYLLSLLSGMDKIFMFNLCDEQSAEAGYLFGSSGMLTSEVTGYKKKQSWKDLDWLIREVNGFTFFKDRTLTENVRVFEFRNRLQSKYFYYSPTSNGTTFNFKIGGKQLIATENVQVHSTSRFMRDTEVKESDKSTQK